MADTVAIVSIVSGATVAIAVPFINAVLERQRLRWQGNQARLDDLRAIVDSTVGDMVRAHDLIWDIATEAGKHGDDQAPDPELRRLGGELTATYEAVKTLGTRIGVRLGAGDDVVVAHLGVESILADAEIAVSHALHQGEQIPTETLWSSRNELGLAVGRFQASVRDLIGPIRERR